MEAKKDDEEKIGNVVVTVKAGEILHVGESEVRVIGISGNSVGKGARLRVTAPQRIKIFRTKEKLT